MSSVWWVVEKKLGGFRKPVLEDLEWLQKEDNVGGIVSLLDDNENLEMYESNNIPHLWIPVKGGKTPTIEQLGLLKSFVSEQNVAGKAVFVHCTNGRRRTGTALIALLIMTGHSFEDAKSIVYTANPEVDLREEQLTFLESLHTLL